MFLLQKTVVDSESSTRLCLEMTAAIRGENERKKKIEDKFGDDIQMMTIATQLWPTENFDIYNTLN